MGNVLVVHNSSTVPAEEPKEGRTVLRIVVEQVNGSALLNCSLSHFCRAVFPKCTDQYMGRHEAVNNTVTIKLSDSCALHSDLLMTLASMRTEAGVVSIGNESTSWNGSVVCHPQYTPVCGLCVPHCNRYHAYLPSNSQWNLEAVAITVAPAICIFGGVIFIVLSIARRKEM